MEINIQTIFCVSDQKGRLPIFYLKELSEHHFFILNGP